MVLWDVSQEGNKLSSRARSEQRSTLRMQEAHYPSSLILQGNKNTIFILADYIRWKVQLLTNPLGTCMSAWERSGNMHFSGYRNRTAQPAQPGWALPCFVVQAVFKLGVKVATYSHVSTAGSLLAPSPRVPLCMGCQKKSRTWCVFCLWCSPGTNKTRSKAGGAGLPSGKLGGHHLFCLFACFSAHSQNGYSPNYFQSNLFLIRVKIVFRYTGKQSGFSVIF